MKLRSAKKVRAKYWSGPWEHARRYKQLTVDRANLRLGGFVVDGVVYDEMRLMELRGHRLSEHGRST